MKGMCVILRSVFCMETGYLYSSFCHWRAFCQGQQALLQWAVQINQSFLHWGNPGFPRLVPVTSGGFSRWLWEARETGGGRGLSGLHWRKTEVLCRKKKLQWDFGAHLRCYLRIHGTNLGHFRMVSEEKSENALESGLLQIILLMSLCIQSGVV